MGIVVWRYTCIINILICYKRVVINQCDTHHAGTFYNDNPGPLMNDKHPLLNENHMISYWMTNQALIEREAQLWMTNLMGEEDINSIGMGWQSRKKWWFPVPQPTLPQVLNTAKFTIF